ncbi:MAG: HipA domain-containing protein [Trueperaceae bacterium]|nr:HipA domain-containing protein [Trueperaceae bacterium]
MTDELTVWLHGREVGVLKRKRNGATFQYAPRVVAETPGVPLLSVALPVQAAPFDASVTRNWFTGLLPEDRQLQEVQRRFGLEASDFLSLLGEIGWECAGAVVIAPANSDPPSGSLQTLDDAELAARLVALPARPFDEAAALRVSLGGYQAKIVLTRTSSGWALPLGGAVSTHILKPQPATQWPGLIEAEAWAMAAAASATPTAANELLHLEGAPPTLCVTRFDREAVNGGTRRLHQEDSAQALGLAPEAKYAKSGAPSRSDPSFLKIARILERYADEPARQLEQLLQQVTVNVALGNTDAHAKNYGLLHVAPGTVSLSPLYDVAPTHLINPGMPELGLRVGDTLLLERVTGSKLVAEAVRWGMTSVRARAVVQDALDALQAGVIRATERYPASAPRLPSYVEARIEGLRHDVRT